MILSLICAMDRNRLIGRDNTLPWRLPSDLAHFKAVTLGKPILMGRKTWDSLGRPLPGRLNIVVSRDTSFRAEGCVIAHSIEEAINKAGDVAELMIIGGAYFYSQVIAMVDRMYLTFIDESFEGDTWFPEFDIQEWTEVECEEHQADEKNIYNYRFVTLERI